MPNIISNFMIDEMIDKMKVLNLTGSNTSRMKEQNALVWSKGHGSVIPYEGFESKKKHKPRLIVDLDPKAERIWKMMMGKEGSDREKEN